ncbi:MAG: hypothetical protein ACTII7_05035 [Galactobacter sp.]
MSSDKNTIRQRFDVIVGDAARPILETYEDMPGTTPKPNGGPTDRKVKPKRPTQPGLRLEDLLPWTVAPKHQDSNIMKKFRTELKQRTGQPTTLAEDEQLHDWLQGLSELGVVVAYAPEAPANVASRHGGFYYVERRPEDIGIVRNPDAHFPEFRLE